MLSPLQIKKARKRNDKTRLLQRNALLSGVRKIDIFSWKRPDQIVWMKDGMGLV